jgi:hypothetical protein
VNFDDPYNHWAIECPRGSIMKVWMLVLYTLYSSSAFCSEFFHIKLDPDFEHYLTQNKSKSNLSKSNSKKSYGDNEADHHESHTQLHQKMMSTLLGLDLSQKEILPPMDGRESTLYLEIRRHLENAHQSIGQLEVQNINRFNEEFNLGQSNFSGFSWQRPFGVVQVHTDRQVTPNVFGTNWLVMDTFTFEIEATTFLEKLTDAGLAIMSTTEIAAFAGITFKRSYTYWHFAESYQEGLSSDFSKLFLPFLKFNHEFLGRVASDEILKREDTWTTSAGGLISTPPFHGISFSAGILTQTDYQNMTIIQNNLGEDRPFKIGIKGQKSTTSGATFELQLDFFKLIKFSLLRYDLDYEYSSGREFTLGLNSSDLSEIKNTPSKFNELNFILKGMGSIDQLEKYIVRMDESSGSSTEQTGNFLVWGKIQKQKTEQIKVIKDNMVKIFFKSYAQNVKIVQNIVGRIFSALVYKLLKLPVGVGNAAVYSRQVTMEHEVSHPQSKDPQVIRVDTTEQFSLLISQYYSSPRTDRWIDRRFKNDVAWFVENFTTLPSSYQTDIKNEILKGPFLVESLIRIEKDGLHHLLEVQESTIFSQLAKVCKSTREEDWTNDSQRRDMMEENLNGRDQCVRDLGQKYLEFKKDYQSHFLKPSLVKFKNFITHFYKKSGNLRDIREIFGEENIFIHGKLQGKTSMGQSYLTNFSSGQFRGVGVIDNFRRGQGSRVPANISGE